MVAFNKTKKFAKIFQKVNSLGAAVVIVGALFKIQHYPGASVMLMVGLLTEAAIFTITAFAPLPVEYHWHNIFPELLIGEEIEEKVYNNDAPVARLNEETGEIDVSRSPYNFYGAGSAPVAKKAAVAQTDGTALAKFNEMLEKSSDKGNFFDKLGNSFADFTENVKGMASVANSAVAAKSFTESLNSASNAVSSINSSADDLSNTLGNVQSKFSGIKDLDFTALTEGNKEYSNNIKSLNGNLKAINGVFEIQLQEIDFDTMIAGLKESVTGAKQYSTEVTKLSKNLQALNTVYGNMLTALNVKVS
ncbi:MAG: gliding motility protein GldL [Bacteroidales bacterium]|jgi:gliding motility-associated protein GldL|nr:gliding motility protein GldL [Bacteroidales bacterium]